MEVLNPTHHNGDTAGTLLSANCGRDAAVHAHFTPQFHKHSKQTLTNVLKHNTCTRASFILSFALSISLT